MCLFRVPLGHLVYSVRAGVICVPSLGLGLIWVPLSIVQVFGPCWVFVCTVCGFVRFVHILGVLWCLFGVFDDLGRASIGFLRGIFCVLFELESFGSLGGVGSRLGSFEPCASLGPLFGYIWQLFGLLFCVCWCRLPWCVCPSLCLVALLNHGQVFGRFVGHFV